jgi:hypothetical protein
MGAREETAGRRFGAPSRLRFTVHFVLMILVCSATVDRDACNSDTAIDLVQKPAASELDCNGIGGQAQFATSAFAGRDDTYIKTVCTRVKDGASASAG